MDWLGIAINKSSFNGVNNMWILKNPSSLLTPFDQLVVRTAISVQTFDFLILYVSIPHDLLKSIEMIEFLINKISVQFGGCFFVR